MKSTFEELQAAPQIARPREALSVTALDASGRHLVKAARQLADSNPNYQEVLDQSLEAMRHAYLALLEWNGMAPDAGASLAEMATSAEQLVNVLRTCRHRADPLEGIATSLRGGAGVTISVREEVRSGYYTARNSLSVVLGSLPERLPHDGILALNLAEAIRMGRRETIREGRSISDMATSPRTKRIQLRTVIPA